MGGLAPWLPAGPRPRRGTRLDERHLLVLPSIKVKKGLHVTAARPAQPALWAAKLDRLKGSKHHTTLITCHRAGPTGPDARWVVGSPVRAEEGGLRADDGLQGTGCALHRLPM